MDGSFVMLFKDGKRKALTLSYDDGTIHDRKLVRMMNQYGIKGTFNLNSGLFSHKEQKVINGLNTDFSRIDADEVKTLYLGHEVASHTVNHPSLPALPSNIGAEEVLRDRKNLEVLTGELVRGFAYPYGTYNDAVENILNVCGIEYARTVISTENFEVPGNFLEWHPTCHHESPVLMELAKRFCTGNEGSAKLFYLWGHSYEFSQKDNWQLIEDFFRFVSGYAEDIWMASNIEVMDYVMAFRGLKWSTDGRMVYNPAGISVWFEISGQVYCIQGNGKLLL